MKASQCTMKSVVALTGKTAPLKRGIIAGPVTNHPSLGEVVVVEWYDGGLQKITTRSLITEYEADQLDAKMFAAAKKLEDEWNALEDQVRGKVNEAAKLLSAAAKIATAGGHSLSELDVNDNLIDAIFEGGWNSSSLSC